MINHYFSDRDPKVAKSKYQRWLYLYSKYPAVRDTVYFNVVDSVLDKIHKYFIKNSGT